MVAFPNCKINLGLNILHKRADGYHELETVYYPLPFCDLLEIIRLQDKDASADIEFTMSGISIKDAGEDNLCLKALKALKKDFVSLPPVCMHLHKNIPPGAGLGGGSADAAFALMLLNQQFNLGLSAEKLMHYAASLGSDCPFFIINSACYATGRGEKLESTGLRLSAYVIVLIYPGIHISTRWVFSQLPERLPQPVALKKIIQQPIESWKKELKNDLEIPVFVQYPEIREIKNILYERGALYASLSGSGSAVYGIFKKEHIPVLDFPGHYLVKILPG